MPTTEDSTSQSRQHLSFMILSFNVLTLFGALLSTVRRIRDTLLDAQHPAFAVMMVGPWTIDGCRQCLRLLMMFPEGLVWEVYSSGVDTAP